MGAEGLDGDAGRRPAIAPHRAAHARRRRFVAAGRGVLPV